MDDLFENIDEEKRNIFKQILEPYMAQDIGNNVSRNERRERLSRIIEQSN